MLSDTHYLKGFYAESQEDNFIYFLIISSLYNFNFF